MSTTKLKGALGIAKAIVAFAELDIPVFQAIGVEHLPYDLVIEDGEGLKKVQVKYRQTGRAYSVEVPDATSWSNRGGTHSRKYISADFDVLALYVREVDRVLFVPFEMCGKNISLQRAKTSAFYWWEDFLSYPPARDVVKRPPAPSERKLWLAAQMGPPKPAFVAKAAPPVKEPGRPTKIAWPTPEKLAELVAGKPVYLVGADLGVAGNAVRKRCISLGIPLKPRGYWAKQKALESAKKDS